MQIAKKVLAVFLAALFVLPGLGALCMTASADENTAEIIIVPDKTVAAPGETVTYTVSIGPVSCLRTGGITLQFPAGLTFVPFSESELNELNGKLANVFTGKGPAHFENSSQSISFHLLDYSSSEPTELMQFRCTVADNASGELTVGIGRGYAFAFTFNKSYDQAFPTYDPSKSAVTVRVPEVSFYVPEAVYLKTGEHGTQWYLNSCGDDGQTPPAPKDTTGKLYFHCDGATSVQITLFGGRMTGMNFFGTDTIADNDFQIVSDNGGTIRYSAKYVVGGMTRTAHAYTYIYMPNRVPTGCATEAESKKHDDEYDYLGMLTALWGAQSSDTKENTSDTDGADVADESIYLGNHGLVKSQNHKPRKSGMVSAGNGTFGAHNNNDINLSITSPTAYFYVDTSRFTNMNQIPNMYVGLTMTDDEHTDYSKFSTYLAAGHTSGQTKPACIAPIIPETQENGERVIRQEGECTINYDISGLRHSSATDFTVFTYGESHHETGGKDYTTESYQHTHFQIINVDKNDLRVLYRDEMRNNYFRQEDFYTSGWDDYEAAMEKAALTLGSPGTLDEVKPVYHSLEEAIDGLEAIPPAVTRTAIERDGTDGYRVYAQVETNGGAPIERVQFPTWTDKNGQDDIQKNWETNSAAFGTFGAWSVDGQQYNYMYYVDVSDHNNEYAGYNTHVYAYNVAGASAHAEADKVNFDYTVRFEGCGATGGSVAAQTVIYGESVTLPSVEREGYMFLGWAETANADAPQYQSGKTFKPSKDTTLYAVWGVAAPSGAIRLVANGALDGIEGAQTSNVWFGNYMQSSADSKEPVKWRVLQNKDGKLFLLSDRNLDVFEYNKEETSVTWETCDMRSWLNGYDASANIGGNDYTNENFKDSAFSAAEYASVSVTDVENADAVFDDKTVSGGNDTTDKVFLLSIADAIDAAYGFTATVTDYGYGNDPARATTNKSAYIRLMTSINNFKENDPEEWWLRTPGCDSDGAALVSWDGYIDAGGYMVDCDFVCVRPAVNIDLGKVLFTSAAEGGKEGDGLTTVPYYDGADWKLTVLDADRSSFTASCASANGDVWTVKYSGAKTGDNEYISAVIVDGDGAVTYYGRLCKAESGDNNTVTVDVSGKMNDGDKLYVFNEQYNGDYKTDLASAPVDVTLTVEPLVTPDMTLEAESVTYGEECDVTVTLPYDATGTVSFKLTGKDDKNTYTYDDVALSGGKAELHEKLNADDYETVVTYSGDSQYAGAEEKITFVVEKAPTELEITTPDGIEYGDTLNVTVTLSGGAVFSADQTDEQTGEPAHGPGSVTISVDGKEYRTVTVDPDDVTIVLDGNVATLEVNGLTAGQHNIEAVFVGDGNYAGSAASAPFEIAKAKPDMTVEITPAHPYVDETVTVTATLFGGATFAGSATSGDGATLYVDGSFWYSASSGTDTVSFTVSGVPYGSRTVKVVYNGDANHAACEIEQSFYVSQYDPQLSVSAEGTTCDQEVVITATLADGVEGTVDISLVGNNNNYYFDSVPISGGKAEVVTTVNADDYTIYAEYFGDRKYSLDNATTTISIDKAPSEITAVTDKQTYVAGDNVVVTVTIPADAQLPDGAAGNVTLKLNGKQIEDITVENGTGTYTIPSLEKGEYTLNATFNGDSRYASCETTATFTVESDPDQDAADAVMEKIDAIGEVEYTDECKQKIDDARDAYDDLTDAQKDLVTNYDTLTDAEAAYALLEARAWCAQNGHKYVYESNDDGTHNVSCEVCDYAQENVGCDYDETVHPANCTSGQYSTFTCSKCHYSYDGPQQGDPEHTFGDEGEARYTCTLCGEVDEARKAQALADDMAEFDAYKQTQKDAADERAVDGDSAEASALIENAKKAIDDVTYDETKTLDENKQAVDAAANLAGLEKALTDQRAADVVEDKIDAIGEVEYTDESRQKIDDAREAYNDLTDEQKDLVDNIDTLTDAEAEYELLDNKAQFEEYKDELQRQAEDKKRDGDSAESTQLIEDAKKAIDDVQYDESKTLDENKQAADAAANLTQLDADLDAHRAVYYAEFYAGGQLVGSVPYTIDTKSIEEPAIPERAGYTASWPGYTFKAGGVCIDAVYETIPYDAEFYADGVLVDTVTYTVETTSIADEEPAVPEKVGHSGAWPDYTLKAGGVRIDAVYTPDPQTVTFDPNGGEGEMEQVNTTWGSTVTLPECTFTAPNGKEFDKWDAGNPGDEVEVKSDLTVKAIWKEKPLTLTADVDPTQTGERIKITVPYARRGGIAAMLTPSEDGVYYESSNPDVISVDKDGVIRLEKLCLFCKTATITAYSADGEKVATCEVNVKHTWWQFLIWLLLGSFWF